jgi:hypothetical protein
VLKVRNLGKYGVITDVDPYDLPPEAWSMAVNARFQNERVVRAPVFRNVKTLGITNPRFSASSLPTTGLDITVIGYLSGRVYSYSSGVETNLSVAGYTDSSSELPYTTCHLADVFYVNRGDRVPWFKRSTDSVFQALGSGWDATWRAKLMRSCGGTLVALNVTKGSTAYPTMVKTSSIPLSATVPASWDITDPSTLATENLLAEMSGGIIDAEALGSALFIYGLNEAWVMTPTTGGEVFDYRLTPFGKGSINANCAIEIGGRHYVFGPNDIWMHDGVSHQSICDRKTRQFIFSTINLSRANRCFVAHFPQRNEIHFCYVSGDAYCAFAGGTGGCNRAAIYNYVEGTWTFDDLPYVFSGCLANLDNTLTYATAPGTYDTGGSYLDQEDSFKRTLIFVGDVSATYSLTASLYAFDQYGAGSSVSFPVDVHATRPMYLERTGIDLDELQDKDLPGYLVLTAIYPQARLGDSAANLLFSFGAADGYNQSPTYAAYQPYNGADLYKLDFMSSGRWLAMRVSFPDFREMTLSGIDLDFEIIGER